MIGKFRVWAISDEHPNGRMYYIGDYHIYPNGVKTSFILNMNGDLVELYEGKGYYKDRDCSLVWARVGFSDVDIMFFTGRKDKNGKEVYGGDIVKMLSRSLSQVYFADGGFCVDIGGELIGLHPDFLGRYRTVEVIGNIYENKNLLKEKEKCQKS